MERFKNFAGFLSLFFAASLIASIIWTFNQVDQLSVEIRPVENKVASLERSVSDNSDLLTRQEKDLADLQSSTLREIDDCVDYNIEENGADETGAREFCVDYWTGVNGSKINGLETAIDRLSTSTSTAQYELVEARGNLQVLELAKQSVQQTGLWLGVGLLAVWGGFHLAYLWGSHRWKTENDLD